MTEAELARILVKWLQADEWEVFQEVQPMRGAHVADVVARRDRLLWVIECKTVFGLKVIEQAVGWLGFAHFISVAVPRTTGFANHVCRSYGVGVLSVGPTVSIDVEAPLNRRIVTYYLGDALRDEQKTFAEAGNRSSERWTPYQQTCRALRSIVEAEPGIGLKSAIDKLHHHYASNVSARCSLTKWIDAGKIRGVGIIREGRAIKLYPSVCQTGLGAVG